MNEVVLYNGSSEVELAERPQQPGSSRRLALPPATPQPPVLPEGDALRYCHTCRAPEVPGLKLKKCSSCLNILYCSGKCQKADWARHKDTCRAGPPADEGTLARYGYTSAAAFSRDIRDYVNAHWWAIRTLTMIKRQIWRDTHPNTPIRQQPRLLRFRLRCQTTRDSHKNRNPATRFVVVAEPVLGDMDQWIRDCPHWWEQGQAIRAKLEEGYMSEYGPDYLGIFSIEYFVPETNSCTMDFLPIVDPCPADPDPHLRQPLFADMAQFSLKSMNRGFPLRMAGDDEETKVSIPGRFVRSERSWQWKALFNSWDEYAPGQGQDDAHRELDRAISARTFFHGPMPDLMNASAWFCTMC